MQVSTLFAKAASDTKGQSVSPTAGTTEWYQWLDWANEELDSFSEVHDWPELMDLDYVITAGVSATSGAMPSRFKKMAGSVNIFGDFYNEVDYDQFDKYTGNSKVFRTGYDNGWFIEWKGALTSGASVVAPFAGYHSSLATSTDSLSLRNPTYLVKRLKERIFKYRQDPIFTEVQAEAEIMLQQMLENEYYKHSQYKGGATTREEEVGFTLGID